MKIYCISILLFSVHLIACTSNKTKQPEKTKVIKVELPYHINLPDKGVDTLKVSSFANNITYVPLETNSKSFLNRIDRIKMNDSIIAISDFTKLLLFKMDGTFIRQIGRTGGGPGEYKYISNFLIKSDTIFIFTNARRSFLKFNLDGKFIGEIDFMQNLGYFKWDTQDNLALYDKLEGKVYFYDSDFNGIDTLLVEDNVSPNRHNFVTTNRFSIYFQEAKGKLLFSNYMSDTIWNISNSKKEAEYVFNLKKKLLPEDLRFEYLNGDFKKFNKKTAPYQKINIIEFADVLFISQRSWGRSNDSVHTVYVHNFTSRTTTKSNTPFVYDDLVGDINVRIFEAFSNEKAIVTAVQPTELLEGMNNQNKHIANSNPNNEDWKKRLSNVKFDDNPILVIIRPDE